MAGVHRYEQRQLSLDLGQEVDPHVFQIDEAGEHGEVFTRRWVVELILDLSGFTADRDLGGMVAVEPSCGSGAFLAPMTERLIESCRIHDRPLADIRTALRAFDLLPVNAELAQKTVAGALIEAGLDDAEAKSIASECVQCGDFLLTSHGEDVADFVLGNPPYIRLEDVPSARSAAYRRACPTMRGRSDIFVGFIEMGLRILKPDGVLGFIVADRWMHNQYGADLRRLVSSSYAVEAIVSMHDVDAFEESVSAYPAVTVIRRRDQGTAVVANASKAFGETQARSLARWAVVGAQVGELPRRSLRSSSRSGSTPNSRGRRATRRTLHSSPTSSVGSRCSKTPRPAPESASAWPAERTRSISRTTPRWWSATAYCRC